MPIGRELPRGIPYKSSGDACPRINIKPLRETNVGMGVLPPWCELWSVRVETMEMM